MKTNTTTPRSPRPYGRQAKGKTTKSVALRTDLAVWLENQSARENQSASSFVNQLLTKLRARSTATR